jgi:hypothetical protein
MLYKKIAFFNGSAHSVNLGRQLLLADKLNHKILTNEEKFANQLKFAESILIADDIDILYLLRLYVCIIFSRNKKIKLNILFLELYTISFRSLINEITWYFSNDSFSLKQAFIQLYYTPKRFLRLIFFRLLLNSNISKIFLPSSLRIHYVRNLLKRPHEFKRVRNLLFNNSIGLNLELKFAPYSYLFIAGNIYFLSDFQEVCQFALESKIKVVVTSRQKLDSKIRNKFSQIIIETGQLSHPEIIELTKNCLAGIAVFSKNNINQNLAASSKLYEYAAYGKPIIVSRVPGVENEVDEFLIKNVFYIDQLNSLKLGDIPLIQSDFDFSFFYENELINL